MLRTAARPHARTLALINRALSGLRLPASSRRLPAPARPARMQFEALEQRLLMSADLLPGLGGAGTDAASVQLMTSAAQPVSLNLGSPALETYAEGDPSFLTSFDLEDFSSPLQAVGPRGSLVHAGGVQGTLDATATDSLNITVEAGQSLALRFSALDAGTDLQARLEVFDADNQSLGYVEAGQAGDGLVLQVAAVAGGALRIDVSSLAGSGSYGVELFLNASFEQGDSTSESDAIDLSGLLQAVPGDTTGATRASVIGRLNAPVASVPFLTETFDNGLSLNWSLQTSNPDSSLYTAYYYYGDESGSQALYSSGDYNGYGGYGGGVGLSPEAVDSYDDTLNEAILSVDLSGRSNLVLEFEQWGWDPVGEAFAGGAFFGSQDADGVAISVDAGATWFPLVQLGAIEDWGPADHYRVDLSAALANLGLSAGSDTLLKFQHFDSPFYPDEFSTNPSISYRYWDNIRISEATSLTVAPISEVTLGINGFYGGDPASLTDGVTLAEGTESHQDRSLWWSGTGEPLDNALVFDLGQVRTVADLALSVDADDDYLIEYSTDGENWAGLVNIDSGIGRFYGYDSISSVLESPEYEPSVEFGAVEARWLRLTGSGGNGFYAVSEFQVLTTQGAADGSDWYQLTLNAGEVISAAVEFASAALAASPTLEVYDASGNLLTIGRGTADADAGVEGFRAPASGSYYLRVSGALSSEYNLAVTQAATLGAAASGVRDITATPVVLDSFLAAEGPSSSASIRVAVLSGDSSLVTRLTDSTAFSFDAERVIGTDIDTLAELNQYDVVVIGDSGYHYELATAQTALRQWVEAGGGLVATGYTVYSAGTGYGQPLPDIDAIVPVDTAGAYSTVYSGTLDVVDLSHPIVDGINDFALPGISVEYAVNGVDDGGQVIGTIGTRQVVVVGEPGNGRSVYLGPTYHYNSSAGSGNLDRLMEQSVAWAGGDRTHRYAVRAEAGDTLEILATPLGAAAGEPGNDLVPLIELFDEAGTLLVSSNSGALSYGIIQGGSYVIHLGADSGAGDVLLQVTGSSAAGLASFGVLRSSIDTLARTTVMPTVVDLTFDEPLLLTSVSPSALTVNGVPALSVTVLSPSQLRFTIAEPTSDGVYDFALTAGALTDIHGQPVEAWSHSIERDTTLPTVTASSLAQQGRLDGSSTVITFTFSEELSTEYLDQSDVALRDAVTGTSYYLDSFSYDAATRTLQVTLPELNDGRYTLNLLSGFYAFKDLLGLPLNGYPSDPLPSGQGDNAGDAFTLEFIVDRDQSLSSLTPALPLGSLVHGQSVTGGLNGTDDVDSYTVTIDGDQLLTVAAAPVNGSADFRMRLSVYDSADALVGTADGNTLEGVALQSLRDGSGFLAAGSYRIELTNLAGEGSYQLQVLLDALAEEEFLGTATYANDSLSTAQDLSSGFVDLGNGGSRSAVTGLLVLNDPDVISGDGGYGGYGGYGDVIAASDFTAQSLTSESGADYYRFDLGADHYANIVASWTQTSLGDPLQVELLDASGTVLATSLTTATSNLRSISDFKAPAAGTYYLRVSGSGEGIYNLVVTRSLAFELPLPGSGALVQDISATDRALGHLAFGGGTGASGPIRVAVFNAGGGSGIASQLNDDTRYDFTATLVSGTQIDTLAELSAYDVVIIGDSNGQSQYEGFATALRQWVEAGGGLVATGWTIYSAGASTSPIVPDINAIVPVDTSVSYNYQYTGTVNVIDASHPITQGLGSFSVPDYIEYSTGGIDPGAQILAATTTGRPAVVVGQPGVGRSAYLGAVYYSRSYGSNAPLDQLLEQAVAWAAGDRDDSYQIEVNEGDVLSISTATPGDGSNAPANTLDPSLELVDASGNVVATDSDSAADGRNAQLTHTATSSGTYTLRVIAQGGTGAYVVNVDGATGGERVTRPSVSAVVPGQGAVLSTPPSFIEIEFSEGVRTDSISTDDLVLDTGGSVTGVEVLAGNRVRFLVSIPLVEGPVNFSLAEGAFTDLQGHASEAYSGGFVFDLGGASVLSSTPAADSGSPFNTWTFTFSEALNPSSVSTSDIAVFTGPSGQNLRSSISSVTASGNTLTVTFSNQWAAGLYTMVLGPDIRDLAGNQMDQDGDRISGEATEDRYSASVTVRSPDFVVTSVSTAETGSFGSPLSVTWTVRNAGSDAARSTAWYDRIYLSRDTTIGGDDITLSDFYVSDADPLAPDTSYTRTTSVTLPINVNFGDGTYYILVGSDVYNYQIENNESNNAGASSAVTLTVPPLPDLVVDSVTPIQSVIEAGKPTTISWTLRNQGGAATNTSWYDQIYLSTDTTFGSGDISLGAYWNNTQIAAGGTLERSVNLTIPTSRTGTWYLIVVTDTYDYVEEYTAENNNNGASTSPVTVLVPTEDLTPIAISAPASANFGQTVQVQWTVRNQGTGPTLNNWTDRIWLSTNTTRGSDDVYLGEYASSGVTPLPVGGEYTRSRDIALPLQASLGSGTYYLLIETDYYNNEPETNETNNLLASSAIALTVPPTADLTVSNVVAPTNVRAGDTAPVRFTLTNQGTAAATNFYYSLSLTDTATPGSSDYGLGTFYFNDTLDAGESVEITQNVNLPITAPGSWYVNVSVDVYNSVYEHTAENNNAAISALASFPLPPLADLVVTDIQAPVDALAGQTVPLTWTIANQGTKDIVGGTWRDRVYLSTNGGGSDSIFVGDFVYEGDLAAGATVTRTQNITLPTNQTGSFTVVIYTDYSNQHYEFVGENNNRRVDNTAINVTFPPLPNLTVSSITPPSDAFSSTQTVVSWVVTNTGTGSTSSPSWTDDVYLSLNNVFGDGDDVYLGQATNPSYLAAGESYANSLTFTVPRGLSGDYYLLVRTDTYNQVFENQSEGDNVGVSALTRFTLTPPPDLQVTTVQAPAQAFSGQPMSLSWMVTNEGTGRTLETSWYDRVFISDDNVFDGADQELDRVWHSGALDADESYTVTRNVNLPIGVVGERYFFVVTDSFNSVYEHVSENNNSGFDATPTTILLTPPPDLEVESIATPAAARTGDPLSFQYTVRNYGSTATAEVYWTDSFYLSADATLDAADLKLGTRNHGGNLAVDGSYTGNVSLTLPNSLANGDYYLIVHTDSGNQVFEGFAGAGGDPNANNIVAAAAPITIDNRPANLVVDAFTAPADGEAGKPITVSWTVRNAGTGSTQADFWVDRIIASRDDILGDDDDIVLASTSPGDTIGVGASFTQTATVSLPFSLEGEYRLYVRVDANNQVYEGAGEGDNTAFSSLSVVRNTPDLRVTSLTPPTTDVIGGPLNLSWRVENQGANRTDSNYWYDEVWLSLDPTLGSGDISLGTLYRGNPLNAGEGYDASASFALPASLTAGDYYVIVRTDSTGRVTEGGGETNNTLVSVDRVYVARQVLQPDLRVESVDAPATAISGQPIEVSWTVRNEGVDPTGSRRWYDSVYLSRDLVFDRNSDLYLGFVDFNGNLAAGESYTQTRSFNVPLGQSGPFYVFVATDSGNAVVETIDGNNTGVDSGFTQVSLAPPADLVVGDITIPVNAIPGQSASLTYTVINQGSNPALGTWRDSIYLSTDDVWDVGDALFGSVQQSGPLAGGSSYSRTLTAALPGLAPGAYRVIVRSDILNTVAESNDANNLKATLDNVAVDVAELALGTPTTGTLNAGQAVYYKIEVGAGETVRVTLDSAGEDNGNELYLRYGGMPSRGVFDFTGRDPFVADQQTVIPTTQAGTYYVLVYAASGSAARPFSLTAEVLPFSLQSVDQESIGNAGPVTLRVDGAKFDADTVFELIGANNELIVADAVDLANSSTAYVTFDARGNTLGSYTLRAVQPAAAAGEADEIVTLATPILVEEGEGAEIVRRFDGPQQVRPGRVILANLAYGNQGDADAMAPIFIVTSPTGTEFGASVETIGFSSSVQLLGVPASGPQDTLRPGDENSLPLLFKSVNAPMRFTARTLTATSNEAIDFDLIEQSLRMPGMTDADWNARWLTQIQPRLGQTWGDYVRLVNDLSKQFSSDGHVIYDVRQLIDLAFTGEPDFLVSSSYSGTLIDADSNAPLANVLVGAYRQTTSGLTLAATAQTDDTGAFSLRYLRPGSYVLSVASAAVNADGSVGLESNYVFDMNRNGVEDAAAPTFVLTDVADISGAQVFVRAQVSPPEPEFNDQAQALATDSAGRTHLVWMRDSQLWHAVNEGSGWQEAAPLPTGAAGANVQIVSDPALIDGSREGLLVSWRAGEGNETEIYYAVGERLSDGSYHWSEPTKLTDNAQFDGAYAVGVDASGNPVFLMQREDASVSDDSDIYGTDISIDNVQWAQTLAAELQVLQEWFTSKSDAELEALGIWRYRWAYKLDKSFPVIGKLGGEARLDLQGQIDCTLILAGNGAFKFNLGAFEIEGRVGGDVRFKANDDCVYEFDSARISLSASGAANFPLTRLPIPSLMPLFYLLDAFNVKGRGEAAVGANFIWDAGSDFPSWPSRVTGSLRGSLGLNWEGKIPWVGDATIRVLVNVNGKIDENGLGFGNPPVSVSALARVKYPWGFREITYTFPSSDLNSTSLDGNLLTLDEMLSLQDEGEISVTYGLNTEPDTGTLNDYTDAGEVALTANLGDEGEPVIAETPAGELWAAWTAADGIAVTTRTAGAWSPASVIPGTSGYVNSHLSLAFDGNGNGLAVWNRLDTSAITGTSTSEDIEALVETGGDVVFARYDAASGTWSAPQTLAARAGDEQFITLQRLADGDVLAAWVGLTATPNTSTGQSVLTARWSAASATWSAVTEVAYESIAGDVRISSVAGQPMLVWAQNLGNGSVLRSTTWNGSGWSDPASVTVSLSASLLSTGNALYNEDSPANTSAADDVALVLAGIPLPSPPEDCCDDDDDDPPYDPEPVVPRDPNDILGPEGFGAERWVAASDTLNYTIRFENAADAAAPAQEVVITQQLDADLDWRTFRVDDFGFGDQRVELDGKTAFLQRRIDLTETKGYLLDVSAAIDTTTGLVTWTLRTIDPATGELPVDAQLGFLPPNRDENGVSDGRGEGFVTYSIKAKRTAATGTVVDATARIIFDTEEPIDTPPIFNTLDAGLPTSEVAVLPDLSDEPIFLVSWSGSDAAGGSALRDYTIYVSQDGGAFEEWLTDTTLTESFYQGERGSSYAFYSVARDNAGNTEAAPTAADATTTVSPGEGNVTGLVFDDLDGDGLRDAGEAGVEGWTVFVDADTDGVLDDGELSALTGADGSYTLAGVTAGTVTIGRVLQAGWVATAPADNRQVVAVVADETASGADFGSFQLGSISGLKFEDRNANGVRDADESALAGWTIQLDRNGDGSIDASAVTGEDGSYAFTGLTAGRYVLTEVGQAGWLATAPQAGQHEVIMTSGLTAGGRDFANVRAASIAGTQFEDLNGNGQRDAGEAGLAGWTVFLDGNANGSLDAGERSTVTGADGSYRFDDLLPGDYTVAEVMQDGWMQTAPASSTTAAGLVQLELTGSDQVLDLPDASLESAALETAAVTGNGWASALTGLDDFRADDRFAGIDGSGLSVVVIDTGIDVNHSFFGADADGNGVADRIVFQYDFAEGDADASDRNGHGSHVSSLIGSESALYGGVATGVDLISLKVFQDDGQGYFSYLENALQWVVSHADEFNVGVVNLSLGDGGNWNTTIGRYGLDDELAALAARNIIVTAAAGNNYAKVEGAWGVAYPAADPAVLSVGATWAGDFGGPWSFSGGSTDYTTGADRVAAFSQRDDELLDVFAPGARLVGANATGGTATMQGTSQASAYMAGVAALAQDLALDTLGRRLSLAEFSALLDSSSVTIVDGDDENDNVRNSGLSFSRVDMHALAEGILALPTGGSGGGTSGGTGTDTGSGTPTTLPSAGPAVHEVTLSAGQDLTGIDFGNFRLSSIEGVLVHDQDADGTQDAGEFGVGGFTVFLDGNANGTLDLGEANVVTAADGSFRFDDLGPGTRTVTVVGQAGWTVVTGSAGVTMSSGLNASVALGVNALPTLAEVTDLDIDEGSELSVTLDGQDSAGDALTYSLVSGPSGASVDPVSGVFTWTPADGAQSVSFTVLATDRAGGSAERSFTVNVANVAPTLSATGAGSVEEGQPYTLALSASDPGADTLVNWVIDWGDGIVQTVSGNPGSVVHTYAAAGTYAVTATATDEDGSYTLAGPTVVVTPANLQVSSFEATATGFKVRFSAELEASQLNLYDSEAFARGASDVVFRNGAGQVVAGSIAIDADRRGFTFVRTGGTLAAGTYSVELLSGANAFVGTTGKLLDGDANGSAGGHYATSFTVAGGGAVLAIGELSRGPGQPINLPATGAGLPITLANAAGATSIAFTLRYDASLMSISGVTNGAGLPAGSTLSADLSVAGEVRVQITAGAALPASVIELVRLQASVPNTAAYGAKQVLDLTEVSINGGAIAVRDDDGMHVVAYLGDTSGNAALSTLDVQRLQRVLIRTDSGFGAWPLVDPVLLADINMSGTLTSLDATRLQQHLTGALRPEIPAIPTGIGPLTFAGADPLLSVQSVSGAAGSTVTVPVTIDTAAGLESLELIAAYPADQLELLDVRLAGVAADFQYLVKDISVPGRLRIDASRLAPVAQGTGTVLEIQFRILPTASGTLAVDLQWAALNDTRLTLNPLPQPGADATDGRITVTPPQAVAKPATLRLQDVFADFRLGSTASAPWLQTWLSAGTVESTTATKAVKVQRAQPLRLTPKPR